MNKAKDLDPVYLASLVHKFLMTKIMILEKQFIIIIQNIGQTHWVTSCYCNPWFTMAKHMKKSSTSVSEVLLNMDEFAHGWLMFDPLKGGI